MKVDRAEILISCASPSQFPAAGPPEVAFLGRSNVGKSSLLNRLVHRKKLARTSSTPGKTRPKGVFRMSPIPTSVAPISTILPARVSGGRLPSRTSTAE